MGPRAPWLGWRTPAGNVSESPWNGSRKIGNREKSGIRHKKTALKWRGWRSTCYGLVGNKKPAHGGLSVPLESGVGVSQDTTAYKIKNTVTLANLPCARYRALHASVPVFANRPPLKVATVTARSGSAVVFFIGSPLLVRLPVRLPVHIPDTRNMRHE